MKRLVVSLAGVEPPLRYQPGLSQEKISALAERAKAVIDGVAFQWRLKPGTEYRIHLEKSGQAWTEFFCEEIVN